MPDQSPSAITPEGKKPNGLMLSVVYSSMATFMTHPARVLLNNASKFQHPWTTFVASRPFLLKGLGYNLFRGSLATGVQSYAKQSVQEKAGLLAGLAAAAACGATVATLVETPFIRKTTVQGLLAANHSRWRFNVTLSSLYFLREAGFSVVVLAKDDLSPVGQFAVLLGGTVFTATAHKFASLEAIRDTLPANQTIPDFKKPIESAKSMARGGVFTHPAFQVPFQNPCTPTKMMLNFMHVACGPNMFLYRLLFLGLFREAYHVSSRVGPSAMGFFSSPLSKDNSRNIEEKIFLPTNF